MTTCWVNSWMVICLPPLLDYYYFLDFKYYLYTDDPPKFNTVINVIKEKHRLLGRHITRALWCSKDNGASRTKDNPAWRSFSDTHPIRLLSSPPCCDGYEIPEPTWAMGHVSFLSQIRKGICSVPLPLYRRMLYVLRPIRKRNFHLGPFFCSLAIKTD